MKKKTKQKTVLGLLSAVVLSIAIGFSTGETSVQAATNLTMGKVNWLTSDQFNFSDLDIGTTESIKTVIAVSYTHLDVYKRQLSYLTWEHQLLNQKITVQVWQLMK